MRDGWEIRRLGDVCIIKGRIGFRGYTREDLVSAGEGAITLSPSNIIDDRLSLAKCQYISWFKYEQSPEIKVYEGDIILAKTASIGKVAIVDNLPEKATVNPQFVVLKKITENNRFLYYTLRSRSFRYQLSQIVNGVAIPTVSQSNLEKLSISVPPIQEQEKIVAELDTLSEVIVKKRRQLEELDKLAQCFFYDMFGEGRAIEGKWEKCRVGDIYKFQYGKGNNIPEDKGEYPCYGSNGLVGHHIVYNSEDAPIIGHIGAYAGIVNWGAGKHYVTYNGVICKLRDNRTNPVFGFYLLKAQDYLNAAKRGGAQPFVSYDLLEAPITHLPPLDLQNKFAQKIEAIEKQKALMKKSIVETETLFNSRMDYWFN